MKRIIILYVLAMVVSMLSFAKQVDENTAKKAAVNFFASRLDRNQFATPPAPELVYTAVQKQAEKSNSLPAFYIFNFTSPPGFVIVAADDAVSPVLAYSGESSFSTEKMPSNLKWWLEGYEMQITEAVSKNVQAAPAIKAEWEDLLIDVPVSSVKSVGTDDFLVKLLWKQDPYYNNLCPVADSVKNLRAPTGCVATAMAMIMKYHNCPTKGNGSHSYTHGKYGVLSADFGSTYYEWTKMPDSLNSGSTPDQIAAVATLMYHCGVSFDINYGKDETSGRAAARNHNANDTCAENALKKYFGFDPNLRSVDRSDSTYDYWIKILKDEIDAKRPVMYGGQKYTKTDTSGHSFICDGYNSSNFFHFNWGWGPGSDNGFFKIDSSLKFPDAMDAIIGIRKNPLGVDERPEAGNIIVCPNPSKGIIEIKLEKGQGNNLQKTTITNMQGRVVYESAARAENDRISVDLSANPAANYIITCYFQSGNIISYPVMLSK